MTEPTRPRPVPGPPRPGPVGVPASTGPADDTATDTATDTGGRSGARFADLAQLPLGEHVARFEAEHDRLQRELGTIDQL